ADAFTLDPILVQEFLLQWARRPNQPRQHLRSHGKRIAAVFQNLRILGSPLQTLSKLANSLLVKCFAQLCFSFGAHLRQGAQNISFEGGLLGSFEAAKSHYLYIHIANSSRPASQAGKLFQQFALIAILLGNQLFKQSFGPSRGSAEPVNGLGLRIGGNFAQLPFYFLKYRIEALLIRGHKYFLCLLAELQQSPFVAVEAT